mgnify:CR=1 FL=1
MAKKKKAAAKEVERVGMTPEREAEIAKETEGALASARKSEEDRVARVGAAGVKGTTERTAVEVDANPGVKFKKKITRDTKTGRAKVADVDVRVSGEDKSSAVASRFLESDFPKWADSHCRLRLGCCYSTQVQGTGRRERDRVVRSR